MNDNDKLDLEEFIDRMRGGDLNAKDMVAFQESLLADPALRDHYRARMRMESHLLATFRSAQPELVPPVMGGRQPSGRRPWWVPAAGLGIAASLVLAFVAGSAGGRASHEPVLARLVSESEAAWSGMVPVGADGALSAGSLELKSGLVELRFESGVLLALEAPVKLDLVDPMRCRLHQGTAVVEVPDGAEGFIVETPGGHAVDHGTRFAVNVDPRGESAEFEVLSGRISVHHARSGTIADLTDAKAVRLTEEGIESLEMLPSRQVDADSDAGMVRLRTGGKETSIIRHTEAHPTETLLDPDFLMVKKDVGNEWGLPKDRRSLIGFALGGIHVREVGTARLRLNLVPTGLGFVSLLPEVCTFAVYGIRDDAALEDWPVDGLRWEDAPGSVDKEGIIDDDEVIRLGSFDLPRGRTSGPVVFESPGLAEFIRADTTGEVGFLLVRETPPLDTWSLVHGFASSTHPVAAGPVLELGLEPVRNPGPGGR